MDAERSEDLTRPGEEEGEIRRGVFSRLSAGAIAALVGGLAATVAESKKRKKKRKKRKKKKKKETPEGPLCERCPKLCESGNIVSCKPVFDLEAEICVCAFTTRGDVACVDIVGGLTCVAADECQFDGDCGPNQACILVDDANCCTPGNTGNLCLPVCDT